MICQGKSRKDCKTDCKTDCKPDRKTDSRLALKTGRGVDVIHIVVKGNRVAGSHVGAKAVPLLAEKKMLL